MKRLFLFLAVAGLMATTACSRDEMESAGMNGDGVVTFSARLPEQLQTRSMGDGQTARKLTYAVYAAGEQTPLLTSESEGAPAVEFTDLKAQLTLRLTTGKSYDVLFWADAYGQKDESNPYKVDYQAQTVTVDYAAAESNDENRDAFFGSVTGMKVTGAMSQDVTLVRPFAQVNVGTDDLEEAVAGGLQSAALATSMSATNVPTTLNLLNGTTTGSTSVDFASHAVPTESLVVSGRTYTYLAMNYLLMGADKTTTNIAFEFTDGATTGNLTFSNVPVQRNYRTNIIGSVLTGDVDFDIDIDPGFGEPDHNLSQLLFAAENGGTVELEEDVELPQTLKVRAGKKMTINLAGHTIKYVGTSVGGAIDVYGELEINGDGVIDGGANATVTAIAAMGPDAKVTINGGSYKVGADENGAWNDCIYAYNGGEITIYGGHFESAVASPSGIYTVLNVNNSKPGTITVYGGEFVNYDPATGDDAGTVKSFVAEGYSSIKASEDPAVWEVIRGLAITTEEDVAAVMAEIAQKGGEVVIPESATLNLEGIEPFTIQHPTVITIDGTVENKTEWMITNDSELTLRGKGTYTCPKGIVRNNGVLTIEGGTWETTRNDSGTAFYNNSADAVLTLKGVDLNAAFFAVAGLGTITIEDGSVSSTSSNKYGSWAYAIRAESGCRMTLKDVTVEGVQGAVAAIDGSHVVCDNASVFARNSDASHQDAFYALYAASEGVIEVLSGSYYSDRTPCALASNDDVPENPLGGFILKGGRFSSQPRSASNQPWTPEQGYVYRQTGDATYPYEIVAE